VGYAVTELDGKLASLSHLQHARSTFDVMRATSAKLGLHAGDIKFGTQNEQ
jgi:hypothetical protein